MGLVIRENVDACALKQAFTRYNRANSFSYEGFHALIEKFDDEEEDVDLDVVAIDCDFAEVTIKEFINDCHVDCSSFEEWSEENDDTDKDNYHSYLVETVKKYAEYHGFWFELLDHDSRIIYQSF